MCSMRELIDEYEESIEGVNRRIAALQEILPGLTGKDIEVTRRKIKIYDSMINDMIMCIHEMRMYVGDV